MGVMILFDDQSLFDLICSFLIKLLLHQLMGVGLREWHIIAVSSSKVLRGTSCLCHSLYPTFTFVPTSVLSLCSTYGETKRSFGECYTDDGNNKQVENSY